MSQQWSPKEYDVFISFSGEDTRTSFVSHLYSALCRDNIKAYKDDESLEKGNQVWPFLCKAIEESQIAIVVFSENYASSRWCLQELVKILKCRKSDGQVVIPVFYEVDPSNIRKCSGSYGEAFATHEQYFHDQHIKEWKAALTEAANISGWDSRSRNYRNESQVIEKIVDDVLEKMNLRSPFELEVEGLVGIDKMCKEINLFQSKEGKNQSLENVQVIGIWGMGGIGKTTIAKALFSQLFPQFDSVCFLANVRDEWKRHGQISIYDKLLSELLKDEHHHTISNIARSTFITRRLSNKKVLVVLDDVDSPEQLDVLCRECKYAGPDSKLIITTRNKHLLCGRVDEIYGVETWSFHKSLELFSLHAFKEKHPPKGYEDLSKRAIVYAGGVPLALKVLGSNLFSRSIEFWDSELNKLTSCPDDRIQNVLQVSYDGLDNLQRKIFLDIVFFFKGEEKSNVIRILNACGFYATSGIKVLEDKALITISFPSQIIEMHDLILDMGLNVVRQGVEDPGKRSRLRDIEEVSNVLENKKGSDAVEGIKLDLSQVEDLNLSADTFNMMTSLRILKLHTPSDKRSGDVHYPHVFNKISDKLRYLEWSGYHLKTLPASFCAKMLVEICMPQSHIKELWQGVQNVVHLARIDLRECKKLKNIPDLSMSSKLIWLNLSGCESMREVHPSVLSIDTLETLILDGCKKLRSLKSEKHFRFLEKISVDGCTSLREFSISSDSIKSLDLSNTGIEKLDSSIGCLKNVESLNVHGLRVGNLPIELSFLKCLKELRICNCRIAIDKVKLHVIFDGLTSLVLLHLKDCCNLFELPNNISQLRNLYELRLDGSSVKTLPASIRNLENLRILSLENCRMLGSIQELPPRFTEFNAVNCCSLVTVSSSNIYALEMHCLGKFISFENCRRLDDASLVCIMKGVLLSAINSTIYQKEMDWFANLVNACLPGSSVPNDFTFRSTGSAVTVNLPPSPSGFLGLTLCVVLSPSPEFRSAKIWCQCYLADGTRLGRATLWYSKAVTGLNSDHVYIWSDIGHFDSILKIYDTDERQVSFEFFVINDIDGERDNAMTIGAQECGVCLIFDTPELRNPLYKLVLIKTLSMLPSLTSYDNLCDVDITNQEQDEDKSLSDHQIFRYCLLFLLICCILLLFVHFFLYA